MTRIEKRQGAIKAFKHQLSSINFPVTEYPKSHYITSICCTCSSIDLTPTVIITVYILSSKQHLLTFTFYSLWNEIKLGTNFKFSTNFDTCWFFPIVFLLFFYFSERINISLWKIDSIKHITIHQFIWVGVWVSEWIRSVRKLFFFLINIFHKNVICDVNISDFSHAKLTVRYTTRIAMLHVI